VIKFIVKRIIYGFLVLFGVVTVVFLLFNVLPGDPARMMLGQRADVSSIEQINRDLGRDKPLFIQYLMYLNDLSPLSVHDIVDTENYLYLSKEKYPDAKILFSINKNKAMVLKTPYLRRSYQTKRKVSEILYESLPETFVLAAASMAFATFFGVLLGIISAIRKDSWLDSSSLFFAVLGMSGPSFFMGLIISWFFAYLLGEYTGLELTGSLYTIDPFEGEVLSLKNLILPAFALGIRPLAVIVQLTRNSLLEVLSQDYIRTATAKGLSFYTVIFKHALKNAMSPVVTAVSGWFAGLMAGSVFIEHVFGWKGIGSEVVSALEKYDLPVVIGSVLVVAIIFVVINILVDIIYGILDPRVRVQ
jgi:peptide/nickel transport system permease protein